MVAALDDPYTVFLPPKENKSSNDDLAGKFGGVGIQLGYKEETLAVVAPLPKTPAENAGIEAGDLILKIVDEENNVDRDTVGISLQEAMTLIKGKVGSKVTLTLYREGKTETFDVTLTRDTIVVASTEWEWVEFEGKQVAWVRLYKFSEQTFKDWPEVVDKINEEKIKLGAKYGGIVLDLRNNPGGYLDASVLVASDFLEKGIVVTQESSNSRKENYEVDVRRRNLLKDKLVVLINGGSASAAEILAGSLRDHGRAKLVGGKSFGKGTVQEPVGFDDGSGLHVTIAKWLLPSGTNIHHDGVKPDVEIKYQAEKEEVKIDNQLKKALEVLLGV
jgi:carboxyl-terminal processing protease